MWRRRGFLPRRLVCTEVLLARRLRLVDRRSGGLIEVVVVDGLCGRHLLHSFVPLVVNLDAAGDEPVLCGSAAMGIANHIHELDSLVDTSHLLGVRDSATARPPVEIGFLGGTRDVGRPARADHVDQVLDRFVDTKLLEIV